MLESVVDLDEIGNGASHRRRGVAVRGRPVVNHALEKVVPLMNDEAGGY